MRVDVDEYDIPRFRPERRPRPRSRANPKSNSLSRSCASSRSSIPKKSLTGENTERVDTRVLPVIYELHTADRQFFVGQQLDVYIEADASSSPAVPAPLARQDEPTTTN